MVLHRLLPGAQARASTADPAAPVVIRFAALGDVVLLTVLLDALCQRYGRPVHVLGSGPWTSVLLAGHPAVSELRLLSSRRAPYWLTPSQQSAVAWLRQHRGPVYLCDPDEHAARFLQRAGVAEGRVVRAWQHWPGDAIHWADWWLQIAALDAPAVPGPAAPITASITASITVGITVGITVPAQPRLQAPVTWHEDSRAWLQAQGLAGHPLVLLQPGHKKTHKRGRLATAGHDKHWPAERWAEVVRRSGAKID
jgi:heptosyltransferase-3